jgi:hypothetical protein
MNNLETLQEIDRQIDRALLLGSPGIEVQEYLSGYTTWITGDNTNGVVSIDVPRDADYYAKVVNVYLSARTIDQADLNGPNTDLAFRPAMWVSTDNLPDNSPSILAVQDANAVFSISDTYNGSYQGQAPIQVAGAYSCRYGLGSVTNQTARTSWPGSRPFFVPYRIRRGHTITVLVQPTFGRQVSAQVKTQFRAVVLFTGYKVIRRPM